MALFGNVREKVTGNLEFQGQCTFTQGLNGTGTGGDIWYVDSSRSASNDGKTWSKAFITIAEAVAASLAGGKTYDTIYVKGNEEDETSDYAESVSVTAAQVGLRIIGVGNSPEGVMWTVGTAEGTILSLANKDGLVSGFRFRPNGATSGKAIDLAVTALGTIIENCIFRSTVETALYGIYAESTPDLTIRNCKFTSLATAFFANASVKTLYRCVIENNLFDDKINDVGIDISGRACWIKNNAFTADTPMLIRTNKSSVGEMNIVSGNLLQVASAYETNCSGASDDTWLGNFCNDVGSSLVGDNGVTIGIPTA